jgi:hypothetical protein
MKKAVHLRSGSCWIGDRDRKDRTTKAPNFNEIIKLYNLVIKKKKKNLMVKLKKKIWESGTEAPQNNSNNGGVWEWWE